MATYTFTIPKGDMDYTIYDTGIVIPMSESVKSIAPSTSGSWMINFLRTFSSGYKCFVRLRDNLASNSLIFLLNEKNTSQSSGQTSVQIYTNSSHSYSTTNNLCGKRLFYEPVFIDKATSNICTLADGRISILTNGGVSFTVTTEASTLNEIHSGRYNGSSYDAVQPYYYNGSAWVPCEWKRYNGSSWDNVDTM